MGLDHTIVAVTPENLADHPQVICYINQKHESHHLKVSWIKEQFEHGLMIKLLYVPEKKSPVGFIEYVPGEYCWRAIDAQGYMFIHCIWTNGKKLQHQGYGSILIEQAEQDAAKMNGVAVMTSDGPFMATRAIFERNGYDVIAESGKNQLLAKSFSSGRLPSINDWESRLDQYQELTILYSKQCPWVARFISEAAPVYAEYGISPEIIELKTPGDVQHGPSMYGTFSLIYRGKLLADRYISQTRFRNIVEKSIVSG